MCECIGRVVPFDKFVSIYIVIKHTRLHSGNLAYKLKIEITAHVGGVGVCVGDISAHPQPLAMVQSSGVGKVYRFYVAFLVSQIHLAASRPIHHPCSSNFPIVRDRTASDGWICSIFVHPPNA